MKKKLRPLPAALAAVAGMTLLAASGLLDSMDWAAADAWYQTRSAPEEDIVLVGIDDRAVEELGPYQEWGRDVIAMAIEALNESEDCRPAAIAVDVLYVGGTDGGADSWLAQAAGACGNVVTACAAKFADTFYEGADGIFQRQRFGIQGLEEPFPALREATAQGHINAMLDTDGILRHHMLYLDLPDGRRVPSMAMAAAEKYREFHGLGPIDPPPTDGHGFWYLPFTGEPGDFDAGISVADLIAGEILGDYFAGKIVLIGPYTTGLQDSYFTSADHTRPMYGVEYQANAIQALLLGEHKAEAGEGVQLALLLAVLFGSCLLFLRLDVKGSTALWLVLCVGWLGLTRLLYAQGLVLRVVRLPLGVTILYVGCIAVNYIRSALEKRRVTATFKRYVAPEIVNELLKEGSDALELGGKLTDIAVLFVDVRGFTTMSEALSAPEVVEILNQYLTLTSDSILRRQGTLDKFVGDATMAFWGAPLPQEDYVMRACQAAMDMVEGSKALSQRLLEKYGRTVSFGIGVHMGPAVVGNIGSPRRMDYTAIGDTVNTSARLEANAPGGTMHWSVKSGQ